MVTQRDVDRFLSKTFVAETGCWEWTAGKKGGGYGTFWISGRLTGAHRAALLLFKGEPLNTPMDAMHSCDNPGCVNPDHISYGTRSDNMKDCSRKGRIRGTRDWRGQKNPKSKLSPEQHDDIVRLVCAGMSRLSASEKFGVTPERVGQLIKAAASRPIAQ